MKRTTIREQVRAYLKETDQLYLTVAIVEDEDLWDEIRFSIAERRGELGELGGGNTSNAIWFEGRTVLLTRKVALQRLAKYQEIVGIVK